jgi:general secretion pathway protein D
VAEIGPLPEFVIPSAARNPLFAVPEEQQIPRRSAPRNDKRIKRADKRIKPQTQFLSCKTPLPGSFQAVDPKVQRPLGNDPQPAVPEYNRSMRMRWAQVFLAAAVLSLTAFAADEPRIVVDTSCPSGSGCSPSKQELRRAKEAFSRGLELEKARHIDEAYEEFDTAARLVPHNLNYVTALSVTREELISEHIKKGSADLDNGLTVEAQAEFRGALNLDPQNQFARQRFQDSMTEWTPAAPASIRVVKDSGEVRVAPSAEPHEFHFRGDSRALLTEVARTFGISAEVEESVVSRRVHFDIDKVDFYAAMAAATDVTGSFWVPLSETQVLLLRESGENHRLYDRMTMRTFAITSATTPQELTEVVNLLRTIFEVKFVQPEPQTGVVVVRAPARTMDAVTQFLTNFGKTRPQVILDIKVFEIDHQLTRNMGVHLPNNFNLFNIPAIALAGLTGLGGQNIQSLINQLISSGGINQANSSAISGLLSQLQGQGNSIFSQPLATFGGGLTFMGLSLDQLSAQLSLNESWVKLLDHATLRAAQGSDATFRIGQRFPVINASFAPIFNSPAISQVLQNGSFQAPIPSFSYEDLGLDLKAKPVISGNMTVNLDLEMQLRNLAGQSLNGVPVIANRQYKGSISLLNGEQAVVACNVSISQMLSMTGIPGLGLIPGLNQVATTNSKTTEEDELMLVITPHIVNLESTQNAEVWMPR